MRQEQDEHTALRIAWRIFVGWWLSALWVGAAWLAMLFVETRPAGFRMIAYLPLIVDLQRPDDDWQDIVEDTLARIECTDREQLPLILRLTFCLVVGWWLSLGWAAAAWAVNLSAQPHQAPLMMFMRLPTVMTLRRY